MDRLPLNISFLLEINCLKRVTKKLRKTLMNILKKIVEYPVMTYDAHMRHRKLLSMPRIPISLGFYGITS